jgi:hypothetical protein
MSLENFLKFGSLKRRIASDCDDAKEGSDTSCKKREQCEEIETVVLQTCEGKQNNSLLCFLNLK